MTIPVPDAASPSVAFRVRLELLCDDGVWCDVNKPVPTHANDPGHARLLRRPRISIRSELAGRAFSTRPWTALLYNGDRFWDRSKSVTLYDDSGVAHLLKSLDRARARVRLQNLTESNWTIQDHGHYRINKISTSHQAQIASVEFIGLQQDLVDAAADTVRDGAAPYEGIPLGDAARKVIEKGLPGMAFASDWPPPIVLDDLFESPEARMNYLTRPGTTLSAGEIAYNRNFIPTCQRQDAEDEDVFWIGGVELGTISNSAGFTGVLYKRDKTTGYDEEAARFSTKETEIAEIHDTADGKLWIWIAGTRNKVGSQAGYEGIVNRKAKLYIYDKTAGLNETPVITTGAWTGTDHYRYMTRDVTHWVLGHVDDGIPSWFGENVACPLWSQMMRYVSGQSPPFFSVETTAHAAALYDAIFSHPGNFPDPGPSALSNYVHRETGWRPIFQEHSGASDAFVRFCMWPYAKVSEVRDTKMYWIRYEPTTNVWQLHTLDLPTSSPGSPAETITTLGFTSPPALYPLLNLLFTRQVTAWTVNPARNALYIAVMEWDDQPANQWSAARGYKFNLAGAQVIVEWSHDPDADQEERYTILWLETDKDDGGDQIVGTAFDRQSGQYGMILWREGAGIIVAFKNATNPLPVSRAPLVGWLWNSADETYDVLDCATGFIWRVLYDLSDPAIRPESSRTLGETWSAVPRLERDAAGRLFGISAPYPPLWPYPWTNYWEPEYTGGWRCWELSTRRSLVIETLDVDEKKCWEVLLNLVDIAGDYTMGVNLSGEFYFRQRGITAATKRLIPRGLNLYANPLEDELYISDVQKTVNYRDLLTVVELTPYRSEIAAPTIVLEPTPESKISQSLNPMVTLRDRGKKKIMLRCVQFGTVGTQSPDPTHPEAATDSALAFAWYFGTSDIFSELAQTTQGNSTLVRLGNLESRPSSIGDAYFVGASRVSKGDYVRVGKGPERRILSVAPPIIILDGPILLVGSDLVAAGTVVRIQPATSVLSSSSADGIAKMDATQAPGSTSWPVDTLEHIRVGMVLRVRTEVVRVTALVPEQKVVRVERGIFGTRALQIFDNDLIQGYINPVEPGRMYEIGGTGAAIGFAPDENLATEERRFVMGDRIIIEAEGARMVEAKHSRVVLEDNQAVEAYGRRSDSKFANPRPNPYIDIVQAPAVARRRLEMWSRPYAVVSGPVEGLLPFDLGEEIVIEAPALFPDEAASDIGLIAESLDIDLDRVLFEFEGRTTSHVTTEADKALPGFGAEAVTPGG